MATLISEIETLARQRLEETTPKFWTSAELVAIIIAGIKDLWRDVVDLKEEHFITISTSVTQAADTATLSSVPTDVHKVIMITPLDVTNNSTNAGLIYRPADYNSHYFQNALTRDNIDPRNDVIFYAITSQGAPVGAPTIRVAPKTTSAVSLSFAYVPVVGTLTGASNVPIPGEADNALVAWTVAYARAKEREDRGPDPSWLGVYATEKVHLLQSLGVRQYQEPMTVDALFESYW